MNDKLLKLFELCGKYKVDFIYKTKTGEKNSIKYEDDKGKRVIVEINNPFDENLQVYIDTRIVEIENILK